MKRILLVGLSLSLLVPSAALASVLLLQDGVCLDQAEIISNVDWVITFSREGQTYRINADRIVEVADAVPENYRVLAPAEFPDYVTPAGEAAPLPEPAESGSAASEPQTPELAADEEAEEEPLSPTPEAGDAFRIQDVGWVDDTDFLFNLMFNGYYQASQGVSASIQPYGSSSSLEASLVELDAGFAGRGYTQPLEWEFNVPLGVVMDPRSMIIYKDAGPFIAGNAEAGGEVYYYPGKPFISVMADYAGYFREAYIRNRIQATVRVGEGRLFRGRHAYQALQIIADLESEGKLLKPLSSQDAQELSAIIAHARNKYLFDQRAETLDAVEQIAEFLKKRGYISDVRSVLIADDTYRYVSDLDRDFGARGYFQYQRLYDDGTPQLGEGGQEEQSHRVGAGCDMAFPLSRIWQLNASLGLDATVDYLSRKITRETYQYYYYSYYYYYPYTYSYDKLSETRAQGVLFEPRAQVELFFLPTTRVLLSLSNQFTMTYGKYHARIEQWKNVPVYYYYNPYYSYYYYAWRKFRDDYEYYGLQWQDQVRFAFSYQLSQRLDLEIALDFDYTFDRAEEASGMSVDMSSGAQTPFTSAPQTNYTYSGKATIGVNYRFF
ncbi:MAG: hypothetical protein AB1439_04950 [candidate division FCPU426 bacterium]